MNDPVAVLIDSLMNPLDEAQVTPLNVWLPVVNRERRKAALAIEDAAMMVSLLTRELLKHDPRNRLADTAIDWIERQGLQGSI